MSTETTKPRLIVIIASTRPGRAGLPIGNWVYEKAVSHGGFEVDLADLAEIDLPLMDEPNHPRQHQYIHDHTKAWSARVEAADAIIFVTPEYNHSFNAPLKNAIDYLSREWAYKPVGFVSYGGVAGGVRAVQGLRPICAVLKMVPISDGVVIPAFSQYFDDERRFVPSDQIERSAVTMLNELARWAAALSALRVS